MKWEQPFMAKNQLTIESQMAMCIDVCALPLVTNGLTMDFVSKYN